MRLDLLLKKKPAKSPRLRNLKISRDKLVSQLLAHQMLRLDRPSRMRLVVTLLPKSSRNSKQQLKVQSPEPLLQRKKLDKHSRRRLEKRHQKILKNMKSSRDKQQCLTRLKLKIF